MNEYIKAKIDGIEAAITLQSGFVIRRSEISDFEDALSALIAKYRI